MRICWPAGPRETVRSVVWLGLGLFWLAAPAGAATMVAILDPSQSSLGGVPLFGQIVLDGPRGLPVAAPTTFDVVGLALRGAGLEIRTDPDSAAPGLGVLRPDGSFEIPFLFATVQPDTGSAFDQTIVDLAGRFGPCAAGLCLTSDFLVDLLGAGGTIRVSVFASVPEPDPAPALAASLAWALSTGGRCARSKQRRGLGRC